MWLPGRDTLWWFILHPEWRVLWFLISANLLMLAKVAGFVGSWCHLPSPLTPPCAYNATLTKVEAGLHGLGGVFWT